LTKSSFASFLKSFGANLELSQFLMIGALGSWAVTIFCAFLAASIEAVQHRSFSPWLWDVHGGGRCGWCELGSITMAERAQGELKKKEMAAEWG
jgi:hypothetical protein